MRKQKLFVRIVCIALAAVLAASVGAVAITAITASAAQSDSDEVGASSTGYINDDYVNLRSGAGTSYSVITCMRENTKLTVNGTSGDWYKVTLTSSGYSGYVRSDYVTLDKTSSSSSGSFSGTGYINDDYVNLRSGAGTSYSVITCMRENTKLTMNDTSGDWYKVTLTSSGYSGYVRGDYVTLDKTSSNSSGSSSSSSSPSSSSSKTGYVNGDYVNLRSGAGTSYSVVTCMRQNTKLTVDGTSGDWYKVTLTSGGYSGYVRSDYVTLDKTSASSSSSSSGSSSSSSKTGYVNGDYVNLRSGAGTGNSVVTCMRQNTKLTVNGTSGDWYKVTLTSSGYSGYVRSDYVTLDESSSSSSDASDSDTSDNSNKSYTYAENADYTVPCGKSLYLGGSLSSSDTSVATVSGGVVNTIGQGSVTIYSGSKAYVINVTDAEAVRFCYASPNSAELGATVTLKAITDKSRSAVRFVVSNGSTSYTVETTDRQSDGDTYVWTGSQKLSTSGKWTIKAYSKSGGSYSSDYTSGEVYVTSSSDSTTAVCGERRASDDVIDVIASYEGFLSSVTADSITSSPTVGYGKVVTSGEQFYNYLTENEAYAYLCATVNSGSYTSAVNGFLVNNGVSFNQQQFDALVCFVYNVGSGVLYNDSELESVLLGGSSSGSGTISAGASGSITGSYVNLRSGAGTSYSVVTCMDYGTKITFVDGKLYDSKWYKVKLSDGTSGYVHSDYASASGSSSSSASSLSGISEQSLLSVLLPYHHASGSCYYGLLYRRIDEAEMFLYGDYSRDGSSNKYDFSYTCGSNYSFGI